MMMKMKKVWVIIMKVLGDGDRGVEKNWKKSLISWWDDVKLAVLN